MISGCGIATALGVVIKCQNCVIRVSRSYSFGHADRVTIKVIAFYSVTAHCTGSQLEIPVVASLHLLTE